MKTRTTLPWILVAPGLVVGFQLVSSCLGGRTNLPLGEICESNDECYGSLVCSYGRCRTACSYNSDCPEGQTCVVSVPVPFEMVCTYGEEGADGEADCPEPLARLAVGEPCLLVCTTVADCSDSQACIDGFCTETDGAVDGCGCAHALIAGYNLNGNGLDLRSDHDGTVYDDPDSAEGIRGGAFHFLTEEGRVVAGSIPSFGEAFTWTVWMRAASDQPVGRYPRIIGKGTWHSHEGCEMALSADSISTQCFCGNGYCGPNSTEGLYDDQWHHLALTWSQADRRLRLFVDGEMKDTVMVDLGDGIVSSDLPFTIGANWDGEAWQYGDVLIDEVYLFSIELSLEQITCVRDRGLESDDLDL